jgi:hypothetical protein
VEASQSGRWSQAEQLFGAAILRSPEEPLSWVARGISRSEQAKDDLASQDFGYAALLFEKQGANDWAEQLNQAADSIGSRRYQQNNQHSGNGVGNQLLQGTISGLRMLAPLAAKALIPLGLGL